MLADAFLARTRTLFTIHNLAYQGLFDEEVLDRVGLPRTLFNMNDLEFYGQVNALKAGILYATAVTTVSPSYSREIQTPAFGCGLDGLLRSRSAALHGILNGVDYKDWDPATDQPHPVQLHARRPGRQDRLPRPTDGPLRLGGPGRPADRGHGHPPGRPEGPRHRLRRLGRPPRSRPETGHPRHRRSEDPGFPDRGPEEEPGPDRAQDRLRRADRPHHLRRKRRLPHPFALRALRLDPDVRHEIRHGPGRSGHGRAG